MDRRVTRAFGILSVCSFVLLLVLLLLGLSNQRAGATALEVTPWPYDYPTPAAVATVCTTGPIVGCGVPSVVVATGPGMLGPVYLIAAIGSIAGLLGLAFGLAALIGGKR